MTIKGVKTSCRRRVYKRVLVCGLGELSTEHIVFVLFAISI